MTDSVYILHLARKLVCSIKKLILYTGPPREIKGPGGIHSESQLHPSCKLKTKKKKRSLHTDNSYPSLTISPYLQACYTAPLKNTVTALLEYLDLTALLEYIDILNRYSRGPSWGLLGPLSGWGPASSPLWAALPDKTWL